MKKKRIMILILIFIVFQISLVGAQDSEDLFETLVLYHPDYNIGTVYDGDVSKEGNVHYFKKPVLRGNHIYFYSPIRGTKRLRDIYFRSFNLDTNYVETMGIPHTGTHRVGHDKEAVDGGRFIAFDYDIDSNKLIYVMRNETSNYRYLSGKIFEIPTYVSEEGNRVFTNFGKDTKKIGTTDATRSHLFGTRYSDMLITDKNIYFTTDDPSNGSIFQFNKYDGSNHILQAFHPGNGSFKRWGTESMRSFPFIIDESRGVRYKMDTVTRTIPTPFARSFRQNFNGSHSIGGGASYIEHYRRDEKASFSRIIYYKHSTKERWVGHELEGHYLPRAVQNGYFYATGPTMYEISKINPITGEAEVLYDMRKDKNAYPSVVWSGVMPPPIPLGEYNGDLIFILPSSIVTPPRVAKVPIN